MAASLICNKIIGLELLGLLQLARLSTSQLNIAHPLLDPLTKM